MFRDIGLGEIILTLVVIGVVVLIVWAMARRGSRSTGKVSTNTALDIARERYARGEITKEQFDQLKKDLS